MILTVNFFLEGVLTKYTSDSTDLVDVTRAESTISPYISAHASSKSIYAHKYVLVTTHITRFDALAALTTHQPFL